MTRIVATLVVDSGPVEVGQDEAVWIAERLAGWARSETLRPGALYVASSDAGAGAAVRFWTEASERGLRFASPRLFPWTLANSPAGQAGLALGVRGPTWTLVGGGEAAVGAIIQALDDLDDGVVEDPAFVVGFDRDDTTEGVRVVALALSRIASASPLGWIGAVDGDPDAAPADEPDLGTAKALDIGAWEGGSSDRRIRPVDVLAAVARGIARGGTRVWRSRDAEPLLWCRGTDAAPGG